MAASPGESVPVSGALTMVGMRLMFVLCVVKGPPHFVANARETLVLHGLIHTLVGMRLCIEAQ